MSTNYHTPRIFNYHFGATRCDFSSRTFIMGVLNVTPDSFSDGGRHTSVNAAVNQALQSIEEGGDIIEIGGESTRPGSDPVTASEELDRVLPVVEQLTTHSSVPISIDTTKAEVANAALGAGAALVNDVSGCLSDPEMVDVIRRHNASVVIMHCQGTPKTMQAHPFYHDVVAEVRSFLLERVGMLRSRGIEQIIVDPGIGFGKTLEHNLRLIKHLPVLFDIGCPILVGPSRKSFIGALLDLPVHDRLEGTVGAVAASVLNGASIVRVHDVQAVKRVVKVIDAISAA
jgi:dihydropteroate synthase